MCSMRPKKLTRSSAKQCDFGSCSISREGRTKPWLGGRIVGRGAVKHGWAATFLCASSALAAKAATEASRVSENHPIVVPTQGGECDPAVSDHMLTDDGDWVGQAKKEGGPTCGSPFDPREECKNKEPPKTRDTSEPPAGKPNEEPDDVEVNLHKVGAVVEIREARHQATTATSMRHMSSREKGCLVMSQKNTLMFQTMLRTMESK